MPHINILFTGILEIMFESFNVPGLYIAVQVILMIFFNKVICN